MPRQGLELHIFLAWLQKGRHCKGIWVDEASVRVGGGTGPGGGMGRTHTLGGTVRQIKEVLDAIRDSRFYDTKYLISDAGQDTQKPDISSLGRPGTELFRVFRGIRKDASPTCQDVFTWRLRRYLTEDTLSKGRNTH